MSTVLEKIYLAAPPPLQNALVSLYGYVRRRRYRFAASYEEARREMKQMEYSSPSRIQEYQERHLHRILCHCYDNVPFYRSVMDSKGLRPKDCDTLDTLERLPIIRKTDVQEKWQAFQSQRASKPIMKSKTSGTTGTGLKLRLSEEVVGYERAAIIRYRGRAGYEDGDRTASFIGRTLMPPDNSSPPFWRYNWADRQLLFSYWHVSDETLPAYIQAYNKFAPEYAHGYPSFLYLIAEFSLKMEVQLYSPRAIFTSSETLHDWQRKMIEKAFGARILDRYASAEKVVSVAQCKEGSYHIDSELGILEIVDGVAVATTLHNLAMPLIRYRIGDALEWCEEECSCGRSLPVIKQPKGRVEDMLVASDGRKFGRLDHIFKAKTEIREAQIVQKETDRILVRVVPRSRNAVSEDEIVKAMRENLGDAFSIDVNFIDQIPREENGKFRFVKSEIAENPNDKNSL